MGKRGPKPTPTTVLKKRGSWRGDRAPEPEIEPLDSLTPPESLSDDAAEVWGQLAPSLSTAGLLTTADAPAFARYCDLLVAWRDQMARVHDDATPSAISALAKLDAMVRRAETAFGLTPSDRVGLPAKSDTSTPKGRFFVAS